MGRARRGDGGMTPTMSLRYRRERGAARLTTLRPFLAWNRVRSRSVSIYKRCRVHFPRLPGSSCIEIAIKFIPLANKRWTMLPRR